MTAGPQKIPPRPARSSAHSPDAQPFPQPGPSPGIPSHSFLSTHLPHPPDIPRYGTKGITCYLAGQLGQGRLAEAGQTWATHSFDSACLGFCIYKVGTVTVASSRGYPGGALSHRPGAPSCPHDCITGITIRLRMKRETILPFARRFWHCIQS